MNQATFLERNSGTPIDTESLLEEVQKITNNDALQEAAMLVCQAMHALDCELESIGFEYG